MKKPLLIALGVFVLLLVLGVWIYLMVFGTPQSTDDVFTNFGIGTDTSRPVPVAAPPTATTPTQVDTTGEALRQLTTRPTAGYMTYSTSSQEFVRYAEQGTGHIYEINLTSGEEVRLSGTTIPRVSEAVFSPSGAAVALTSITGYTRDVFAGLIASSTTGAGTIDGTNLPPGADEIAISDTAVEFVLSQTNGSTGYRYNLATNEQVEVFTVPFTSIRAVWGEPLYLYNRPDPDFESGVFTVSGNTLTPVLPADYGQVVLPGSDYIISTKRTTAGLASEAIALSTDIATDISVLVIPEKCAFAPTDTSTLFCGAELTEPNADYIRDWYMGTKRARDFLWNIDLTTGDAVLLTDLQEESGRQIDVTTLSTMNELLFFRNKLDNTLWLYDRSIL